MNKKQILSNFFQHTDYLLKKECSKTTVETKVSINVNHQKILEKMNDLCKKRFQLGPTLKDGPGWIYIYKVQYLEQEWYKIGMSKNLPGRRVYVQSCTNGKQYSIVFTIECKKYRYFVDSLIKKQLTDFNKIPPKDICPPKGDGYTEWYTSQNKDNLQFFTRMIQNCRIAAEDIYIKTFKNCIFFQNYSKIESKSCTTLS